MDTEASTLIACIYEEKLAHRDRIIVLSGFVIYFCEGTGSQHTGLDILKAIFR